MIKNVLNSRENGVVTNFKVNNLTKPQRTPSDTKKKDEKELFIIFYSQERYFEEFPHPQLSVNNFTYVRRPLELNNEAYEIVR